MKPKSCATQPAKPATPATSATSATPPPAVIIITTTSPPFRHQERSTFTGRLPCQAVYQGTRSLCLGLVTGYWLLPTYLCLDIGMGLGSPGGWFGFGNKPIRYLRKGVASRDNSASHGLLSEGGLGGMSVPPAGCGVGDPTKRKMIKSPGGDFTAKRCETAYPDFLLQCSSISSP